MKKATDSLKLTTAILVATLSLSACTETEEKSEPSEPSQPQITEDISLIDNDTTSTIAAETDSQGDILEEPPPQMDQIVEMMDNPQYTSWAKFGVGTKITLENSTESQGMTQTAIMTQTLTDINPDSLIYEMSIKTSINGQDMEMPPQQQTVPAKIPAGTPTRPSEVPGVTIIEERQEVVTVGDKSFNTRVTKFEMQGGEEQNNFTSTTTVWESDEVPGMMVRMESVTTFGGTTSQSTLALKQVDVK